MAKQKPKRWWLSRDGGDCDFYNFHHMVEKPKPVIVCYPTFDVAVSMSGPKFRKVFAIRLKGGACVEIERPVLVLKTKKKKGQ